MYSGSLMQAYLVLITCNLQWQTKTTLNSRLRNTRQNTIKYSNSDNFIYKSINPKASEKISFVYTSTKTIMSRFIAAFPYIVTSQPLAFLPFGHALTYREVQSGTTRNSVGDLGSNCRPGQTCRWLASVPS